MRHTDTQRKEQSDEDLPLRVATSSLHLSQPSLTPPARDAHPVSYSFLFPVGRKLLELERMLTQGGAGRK
ncbi:hypothetical protein EYF80_029661 [Liparis tanakae]|uniref:Uncharacterized protein n=1 Tax=Liparis tanakae TaxID=230148 RepID=A0A4Z2H2W5_9TELE|nr:hypothetical protein EYF80_029661 [Liparis tanakae]